MLSFFKLDKFHDRDLIAWLNGIESKLHSYLIRQCMRYVKDNNIPILIIGKNGNQLPVVSQPQVVKQNVVEKIPTSTMNYDEVILSNKQITPTVKGESKEEIKARLNKKIGDM
jgi:hypothetical protein